MYVHKKYRIAQNLGNIYQIIKQNLLVQASEMQLAIKNKSENRGGGSGVPWPPAGSLGNAPCPHRSEAGQKQHSQKSQGFDAQNLLMQYSSIPHIVNARFQHTVNCA